MKGKKIRIDAFFALFALGQLSLLFLVSNWSSFSSGKLRIGRESDLLVGNIFLSGNTFGVMRYSQCGRTSEVLAKKVGLLDRFQDYLFIDTGNLTSGDPRVDANLFSPLTECLKLARLRAINATKNDLVSIAFSHPALDGVPFISANLGSDSIPVNKVSRLPFRMNGSGQITETIDISITGIADNPRITNGGLPSGFFYVDPDISLKSIGSVMGEADLKILLVNYPLYKTKSVLEGVGFRFDLIVCQSSRYERPRTTTKINGTPVIILDESGRELTRVKVVKRGSKYDFAVSTLDLMKNWPTDKRAEEIVKAYFSRMEE